MASPAPGRSCAVPLLSVVSATKRIGYGLNPMNPKVRLELRLYVDLCGKPSESELQPRAPAHPPGCLSSCSGLCSSSDCCPAGALTAPTTPTAHHIAVHNSAAFRHLQLRCRGPPPDVFAGHLEESLAVLRSSRDTPVRQAQAARLASHPVPTALASMDSCSGAQQLPGALSGALLSHMGNLQQQQPQQPPQPPQQQQQQQHSAQGSVGGSSVAAPYAVDRELLAALLDMVCCCLTLLLLLPCPPLFCLLGQYMPLLTLPTCNICCPSLPSPPPQHAFHSVPAGLPATACAACAACNRQ